MSLASMYGPSPLTTAARAATRIRTPTSCVCRQCRAIRIQPSASPSEPAGGRDAFGPGRDPADARFEVLGSPHSLLSVSLSASQQLYTRRGTLVSVEGKVENARSILTLLSPLVRAPLRNPFLYQRLSSTSPLTALIAPTSPTTSLTLLHLDGTTDWLLTQPAALLAWTGHTLRPTPRIQRSLPLAHWGATHLTGRGNVALAAPGMTFRLELAAGEDIVLHPGHVVAYSLTKHPPLPFRFKSTGLQLSIPALPRFVRNAAGRILPLGRFARFRATMRESKTYRTLAGILYALRTIVRRSVWGDRLFLQFKGPTTVVVSSRGAKLRDMLTDREVNETADVEPGVVQRIMGDGMEAERAADEKQAGKTGADNRGGNPSVGSASRCDSPVAVHVAAVGKDGKVSFEDPKDLKAFVRKDV